MKKVFLSLAIVAVLSVLSCKEESAPYVPKEEKSKNLRITTKYSDSYYEIIEIDGVEYVAPHRGGITPLIKNK